MSRIMPGFPEFVPGEPASREEMQRVADAALAARRADGLGGPSLSSAGTFETQPGYRFGTWFRLTDWTPAADPYPARYSGKEVFWDGLAWVDREAGIEVVFGLRELDDGIHPVSPLADPPANPPVGRVVWARLSDGPDDDGAPWVFAAPSPRFGTFARLTATSGGLVSWKEVYRSTGGGWSDKAGGLTGTLNAVEANGLTGFAADPTTGDVVWLWLAWPSPTEPLWVFFCTTCGTTTLEPCQGCGCWVGQQQNSCLVVDLISVGGGQCACLPQPQGPWYLRNEGAGWVWDQVLAVSPDYFMTCCLNLSDGYGGYESAGPLVFGLDGDWRPYLFVQGTFPTCSDDPTTDYLGGDVTDPRFSLDCCAVEGGIVTAYFRGGSSVFCNGAPVNPECDNTFVLRVRRAGILSCLTPVTGCCPDPLPPVLYLHVDVASGAPAWASYFAGDWTLGVDGSGPWSAFYRGPDGHQGILTLTCTGTYEFPAGTFWFNYTLGATAFLPPNDTPPDGWPGGTIASSVLGSPCAGVSGDGSGQLGTVTFTIVE